MKHRIAAIPVTGSARKSCPGTGVSSTPPSSSPQRRYSWKPDV